MSEEAADQPEIIIDDDWKSRAQAEKEQLQKAAEAKRKQPPAAAAPDEPPPTASAPEADLDLPPASFSFLITSLATQALAAMGQIPGADGQAVVQRGHAKHFIDTLDILEEKTQGNLAPDESAMLTNVLHQLRMLFVSIGKPPATPATDPSD